MMSKAKVKSDQEFYHPVTASLLCPIKYPKTDEFVLSFFYSCVVLKFYIRTIQAIRAGTLAVTAQLLPSFLFPDGHVYDANDISHNVLRGHIMIRVFNTYVPLILVKNSSRSQSISFKARQLLLSHLVLTVENREMHRFAAWHRWLLTRLRMLPYRYVIMILVFSISIDIWQLWTGTLCYEFDRYMGQYRWAVHLLGFLLANSRFVWRWGGSRRAH